MIFASPIFVFAVQVTSVREPDVPRPVTVVETNVKLGSIEIPDEIGPAIAPYMTCRILASGTELRFEGKVVKATKPSAADCDKKKKDAVEYAHKLLKKRGISDATKRTAMIDKTLFEVDAFANRLGRGGLSGTAASPEKLENERNAAN